MQKLSVQNIHYPLHIVFMHKQFNSDVFDAHDLPTSLWVPPAPQVILWYCSTSSKVVASHSKPHLRHTNLILLHRTQDNRHIPTYLLLYRLDKLRPDLHIYIHSLYYTFVFAMESVYITVAPIGATRRKQIFDLRCSRNRAYAGCASHHPDE